MKNQTAAIELTYSELKKRQYALHHDSMCALKYTEHTAKLFNDYIQEMLAKGSKSSIWKRSTLISLTCWYLYRTSFTFFTLCEYLFQRNLYKTLKNYKTDEVTVTL